MRGCLYLAVFCFLRLGGELSGQETKSAAQAFAEAVESRIEAKPSVPGDEEGWLFLVRELRHLGLGKFWEKPWQEVAANRSDPVSSMVEFHGLLAERGIELLLVPVPAKGRIYPEKVDSSFAVGDPDALSDFVKRLRERGLRVIDLESHFLEIRRKNAEAKLYCAQDAHYAPAAIEEIARILHKEIGIETGQSAFSLSKESELTIMGDQVSGSEWEGSLPRETLTVRYVMENGEKGVSPNPASPVLLLGDSHTLVFHAGEENGMHSRGAGLLDHLSYELRMPLDLVGVRGSGLVQARKQLYFRATSEPGFWDQKRCVVWVFSEREWTQSTDRLMSIPLDR